MEKKGVTVSPGHAAHHIVPKKGGGELGDYARELLHEAGLSVNDEANGAPLPVTTLDPRTIPEGVTRHGPIHTERNLQAVVDEVRAC